MTKEHSVFPDYLDNFRLIKLQKRCLGGTAFTDYEIIHYLKKVGCTALTTSYSIKNTP